jgi:proteic killer suppression protein
MINSFKCKETEKLFKRAPSRKFLPSIHRTALKKLLLVHAAQIVEELRLPPGNRLERLKSERSGQYSIRVNDQWRICFAWKNGNADNVEIVDYHRG